MAKYVRRRMYSRRRGSKTSRRRSLRRGGVVKKLARAVRKLRKDVGVKVQRINTRWALDDTLSNDVNVINLTAYTYQSLTFGASADDVENNSCRHVSTGMDILFTANTEKDNINFTVFLVSCRDEAAPFINYANGALTLTSGVHYETLAGLTMVNKKYFNVHKIKRFTTGNFGAALNTSAAAGPVGMKRMYWKFRPNQIVKNNSGNWKDLPCPRDPSQNYYLLMFNDNSGVDLENPRYQLNLVSTFRA